jgi:hypothetical protein
MLQHIRTGPALFQLYFKDKHTHMMPLTSQMMGTFSLDFIEYVTVI